MIQIDDRVRAQHQCVRILLSHRAGLAIGIELRNLAWGEMLRMGFRNDRGHDLELEARFPQQFFAPGRCGSEDEGREGHLA